ncbi:MAG: proteasome accessory factor PafA2 family protein, partial [Actinomycetes bacterium]
MWKITLDLLISDPNKLIGKIDWLTKKYLIDKMSRGKSTNSSDVIKSIDFQYSEITSDQNIMNILKENKVVHKFFDDKEVKSCEKNPPETTRAYFRANMLKKFPQFISAASWDNVILDLDPNKSLLRIPTTDPYGFNFDSHSAILNQASSIQELVSVLSGHSAHR